jgi:hypothetical protein
MSADGSSAQRRHQPKPGASGAAAVPQPLKLSRFRLGSDARVIEPAIVQDPSPDAKKGDTIAAVRVNNISPLQWLSTRNRDPLEPHQIEAGRRAEQDFMRARGQQVRVADVASAALYRTHQMMQDAKTWTGRGAAKVHRGNPDADYRIDAVRRLGAMQDHVGAVSFKLLSMVIGAEMSLAAVAEATGEDPKFIGRRFREALDDAASFYSLAPRGHVSHPGRVAS